MNENIDINLLTDTQLVEMVNELNLNESFTDDSILRKLAKQHFGGDSLVQIIALSNVILPIVTERMRFYSPFCEY